MLSPLAPRSQIQAAPMQSILARLRQQEYIKLVVFSDHTILKEPVEQWPLCNCLIAFYSKVTAMCSCYVWRRGTSGELQYQCMQGAISHASRRPPDVILHRSFTWPSTAVAVIEGLGTRLGNSDVLLF